MHHLQWVEVGSMHDGQYLYTQYHLWLPAYYKCNLRILRIMRPTATIALAAKAIIYFTTWIMFLSSIHGHPCFVYIVGPLQINHPERQWEVSLQTDNIPHSIIEEGVNAVIDFVG